MKCKASPLGVRVASAWAVTSEQFLKCPRFIKYLSSADGGRGKALLSCSLEPFRLGYRREEERGKLLAGPPFLHVSS